MRRGIVLAIAAVILATLFTSLGYYFGRWVMRDEYSVSYTAVRVQKQKEPSSEITVDINSAGAEELQSLEGIGPKLAERIIEYRKKKGPFQYTAQLMNVTGIGDGIYNRIKSSLTVK